MILHQIGYEAETIGVHAAKVGRRLKSIELDVNDFMHLSQLPESMLREWLLNWMCGFPPSQRPTK